MLHAHYPYVEALGFKGKPMFLLGNTIMIPLISIKRLNNDLSFISAFHFKKLFFFSIHYCLEQAHL